MQTDENIEKCTLIIYLAAHIYIVAVLRSLFISHILVFLVLIIQHIVPKIYTLGAKCGFYGVKCMKKELSVFINRTLYDLVPGSDCDVFFHSFLCDIGDWFPVTSSIYCFSLAGNRDILRVCLCHFKPAVLTFTA